MKKYLARHLRRLANRLDGDCVTVVRMAHVSPEDAKAYARKIADARRFAKGGYVR